MLLCLFCKYSWVLNIIVGFTKYCQFVLPYCQYMVGYHQNLGNMLHNSVIMQSFLRLRKKYKFSSLWGILHISAKLQGGICKTSCWLTEKFNGEGKLINIVQFQWGNWSFVNFNGVIDKTYNFEGGENIIFTGKCYWLKNVKRRNSKSKKYFLSF